MRFLDFIRVHSLACRPVASIRHNNLQALVDFVSDSGHSVLSVSHFVPPSSASAAFTFDSSLHLKNHPGDPELHIATLDVCADFVLRVENLAAGEVTFA